MLLGSPAKAASNTSPEAPLPPSRIAEVFKELRRLRAGPGRHSTRSRPVCSVAGYCCCRRHPSPEHGDIPLTHTLAFSPPRPLTHQKINENVSTRRSSCPLVPCRSHPVTPHQCFAKCVTRPSTSLGTSEEVHLIAFLCAVHPINATRRLTVLPLPLPHAVHGSVRPGLEELRRAGVTRAGGAGRRRDRRGGPQPLRPDGDQWDGKDGGQQRQRLHVAITRHTPALPWIRPKPSKRRKIDFPMRASNPARYPI